MGSKCVGVRTLTGVELSEWLPECMICKGIYVLHEVKPGHMGLEG